MDTINRQSVNHWTDWIIMQDVEGQISILKDIGENLEVK